MIGTLCKEYTLLSEEEINKIREVSDFPIEILNSVYSSIEFFSVENEQTERYTLLKKVRNKIKRTIGRKG